VCILVLTCTAQAQENRTHALLWWATNSGLLMVTAGAVHQIAHDARRRCTKGQASTNLDGWITQPSMRAVVCP
jgi:hypothetical protein